jgi:uncharacterized protein YgiM (DUF1202 family)
MKKIYFLLVFFLLIFLPFIARADVTTDYNKQYNLLQQQILDIKTQYYGYIAGLQNSGNSLQAVQGEETKALNDANTLIAKIQIQEQQLALNYQNQVNTQLDVLQQKVDQAQATLVTFNNNCASNNGYVGADHNCYCNDGYQWDDSKTVCITYNQSCQNKYGINSYGDKNYCHCSNGFAFNSGNTACIEKKTTSGGVITCDPGYTWNTKAEECVKNTIVIKYAIPKNNINVRISPSSSSKIMDLAKKNYKYEVIDLSNNNWVKVKFSNKIGWLSKSLVTIK